MPRYRHGADGFKTFGEESQERVVLGLHVLETEGLGSSLGSTAQLKVSWESNLNTLLMCLNYNMETITVLESEGSGLVKIKVNPSSKTPKEGLH